MMPRGQPAPQAAPAHAQPNLYLVGFMGTGKTAVGRAVARELGMRFIDSDQVIQREAGLSIPEIFARDGEAAFRRLERAFIESGHPPGGCVVATGGGLVVQPGMRALLRGKGIVVALFASVETVLKRTSKNRNRPLLNVQDPARRVRELMAQRESCYLDAGTAIMTDHRGLSEVVANIIRVYRREVRRRERGG